MSVALLIEHKIIPPSSPLQKKVQLPPNQHNLQVGIVLLTEKSQIKKLHRLPLGDQRVAYLSDPTFLNSIRKCYTILYNNSERACQLQCDMYKDIKPVLLAMYSGFDTNTVLMVRIALNNKRFDHIVSKYCQQGFISPYKDGNELVMLKENIPSQNFDSTSTLHEVQSALAQTDHCQLKAKFSSKALKFLRNASKSGFVNGVQREIGGTLVATKAKLINHEVVHEICIDEDSVNSGSEESIDIGQTRYNFHSHPEQAYIRHKVDRAWPSMSDYLAYLNLGRQTIFHCVAALEGVYVMSFTPYWVDKLDQVDHQFIRDNFNVKRKKTCSPNDYTKHVNQIKYKGKPIFHIIYLPWEQSTNVFAVGYSKGEVGVCLPSQKGVDMYESYHSEE